MLWRATVEKEVESELAFHLEMTTRELMERGMTRQQARAEAERRFGDRGTVDAECRRYGNERDRKERRAEHWDELRQDIVFSARQLRRARAFTAVAILTLALGIGATAAVFSALDAVVLRPLPFDHPERIVTLMPTRRGKPSAPTPAEFLALRDSHAFEHVAAGVLGGGFTMTFADVPEMIDGARVSADYFATFDVRPQLGRTFSAAEDSPSNAAVIVISHRLWVSHFNADRGVVGRSIQLDGTAHTIIGVMPASFDLTRDSENMWIPLALASDQANNFGAHYLQVVARLPAGMTLARARSAATSTERTAAQRAPDRVEPPSEWGANVRGFADDLVGDYRSLFVMLLGAVGFVLLIACTNVANLLLARGSVRSKELAIRAALGAGRARLVRQLLTESLLLGVSGAVLGLGVAYLLLHVILGVSPEGVPRLDQARIDWRVLAFTLTLGVASCVLFGLLPALRAAGPRLQGTLGEGGRRGTSGRHRVRGALVAIEVALAMTLLVGSGLLIRSALLVQRVDPGFDPRGVLTARFVLPEARYATGAAISRAYSDIRERATQIPGVAATAVVSVVPLSSNSMHSSVRTEDRARSATPLTANLRLVSDGYFATMRIPLTAGRDVSRHDDASSPLVVVINEALATALWPNTLSRNAVGKRIDAMPGAKKGEPHLMEVIGIVGDLHEEGLNEAAAPAFYAPVAQTPEVLWPFIQRSLVVVMRAATPATDAQSLEHPLRRAVVEIDPSLPIAEARTMESFMRESLATARMNTLLLSLLGGIALVLAMVGIYGVVSYFVSQRTHEIGIRMALGATPGRIWQYVVRMGLTPIVVGLAIGFVLSTLTTTVLRQQLFRVSAHDPLTLGASGITLLFVGLLAAYVPARRAMRVPPVIALNEG
jgi:putative ABC transport system permease protein